MGNLLLSILSSYTGEMVMERKLICNKIKTPDGTVLRSNYRHDYREHVDANGETYMTDGGTDYLRRSVNKVPAECLDVYTDAPYKEVREAVVWGTYGLNPTYDTIDYVRVSRLSNKHIHNILTNIKMLSPKYKEIFKKEQLYRVDNNITIQDTDTYEYEQE